MTDIQTWIDQGKKLADQATEGPWFTSPFEHDPVWGSVVTGGVDDHDEDCPPCIEAGDRKDAEFIADARTRLPQALNALQAVLKIHAPIDALNVRYRGGRLQQVCTGCGTDDGNWNQWPCPTVRAITDAIGENNE